MNKPTKREYGYYGGQWPYQKAQDAYYEALKAWENRPRNPIPGRKRDRPIHPSWLPFLDKFQPIPGRSQGAFCAWAGLNRATFSAMQTKPTPMHVVELIGMWEAQEKEVKNG